MAQNSNVSITADDDNLCVGESTTLHANYNGSQIIDFETGDFSQADFNNTISNHPWVITTSNPYEGVYCIKSNCDEVNSATSAIQLTVDVPYSAVVSFYVKTSSEFEYDFFNFYIDNVKKCSLSGNKPYLYQEFTVSQGHHIYKWEYAKDFSVSSYDDCVYIDNITLYTHKDILYSYDFEDHTMQGWTTIDADGDGNNWMLGTVYTPYGLTGHNGSSEVVTSQSYINEWKQILYPNNYLVSPVKITAHNGTYISLWACNQDVSYENFNGEHFGVAVSTTNNTNASAFTTIQEWTLNSKGMGQKTSVTRSGNRQQGNWQCFIVDLSAYAGQNIWIAIRHFNSSDEFMLDVDDITIGEANTNPGGGNITYQWSPGGGTGPDITVSPTQTTTYTVTAYSGNNIVGNAQHVVVVRSVPNNVYITTNTGGTTICEGEEITLQAHANVQPTTFYSPGDILCTDGSIVKPANWPVAGKTAKGIVFYVDRSGQHGWAVSKTSIDNKRWSSNNYSQYDIPGLTNYENWLDAIKDFDGYTNTQIIRDYSYNSSTPNLSYPAAWAVDFESGWYIPAAGQLNVLFGEILVVNNSLALPGVGGTQILPNNVLWSSTEYSTYSHAIMIELNTSGSSSYTGRINHLQKNTDKNVRAVIDF